MKNKKIEYLNKYVKLLFEADEGENEQDLIDIFDDYEEYAKYRHDLSNPIIKAITKLAEELKGE